MASYSSPPSKKPCVPPASHSSPPSKKPCVPPPNWLELPADLCASIFRRLGAVEILTRAQHVCSTWRRVCRDPSMWRSIDIDYPPAHYRARHKLTELYRRAVDLSSGGLLDVKMDCDTHGLFCLPYIAERSNHLRGLSLLYCMSASDRDLIEVAGKFPFLEELELSHCYFSSEAVAAFGRHCPLLKSLKLNNLGRKRPSVASDDEAFTIAKTMSGLHHLQIFGNRLTDAGLIAILDSCRQLESLDLRQCFNVNLDADLKRRCTDRIQHFRGPNDSTDDYPYGTVDFIMSGNESDEIYWFLDGSGDELDDEEIVL